MSRRAGYRRPYETPLSSPRTRHRYRRPVRDTAIVAPYETPLSSPRTRHRYRRPYEIPLSSPVSDTAYGPGPWTGCQCPVDQSGGERECASDAGCCSEQLHIGSMTVRRGRSGSLSLEREQRRRWRSKRGAFKRTINPSADASLAAGLYQRHEAESKRVGPFESARREELREARRRTMPPPEIESPLRLYQRRTRLWVPAFITDTILNRSASVPLIPRIDSSFENAHRLEREKRRRTMQPPSSPGTTQSARPPFLTTQPPDDPLTRHSGSGLSSPARFCVRAACRCQGRDSHILHITHYISYHIYIYVRMYVCMYVYMPRARQTRFREDEAAMLQGKRLRIGWRVLRSHGAAQIPELLRLALHAP
jgi:hypothetical protein